MSDHRDPKSPRPAESELGFKPPNLQVDVRQVTEKTWELLATLEYRGLKDHFTIPAGTRTDFASVPRPFVWFIPTYGKYTKAAILHDVLCDQAKAGTFSRRRADAIFRQAMRMQGVDFLRRWVVWAAVRLFGFGKHGWLDEWRKDLVPFVLAAVLGLVVAVVPALLVIAALLVWWVFEEISYWFIKVTRAVRPAPREERDYEKRLNPPDLSFKM